jgi:stage II sporulation protein D
LLWNTNLAPLKGVACNFCKDSPHFNWHSVLALSDIEEKLSAVGYKTGAIKDIVIDGKDASGRIISLKIINETKETKIPAKDFRNIIGPNEIKSTNFTFALGKYDVTFDGLGWGHGVGLCQWGAYFMAKLGRNYKEILQYYYPHANVKAL